MIECKECHTIFESDKSFHGHLRKHKLRVKDYYEKHYPRLCLHTGKKLSWKEGDDLQSYLSRDFIDKTALFQYFDKSENKEEKTKWLTNFLTESCGKHNKLPSHLELASLPIAPNFITLQKYLDISTFLSSSGNKALYDYTFDYKQKLPITKINPEDFCINIDTREQNPYRFYSSIVNKLSEGDYALAGKLFNNVIIERKSISDFGGTVVGGNERFRRELDRVRAAEKYLIVLVEFNIHDLYKHKFYGYSNPAFVSHNMRGLVRDYGDCTQFVFGINREMCVKFVVEFLLCGPQIKNYDLQLYVDTHNAFFRNEEFTKSDLLRLYDISS